MRYDFKRNDGGKWTAGWFVTCDGVIVAASPAWKQHVGEKVDWLYDRLRVSGFSMKISECS